MNDPTKPAQRATGADEQASRRASEESFRLLVESVLDYAIFQLDPDGLVVTWNIGAERIKGYRAEEVLGQHFSMFYPEDQRAGCDHLLRAAAREGRAEDEGWRVRRDGSRFWANAVLTPLRDDDGRLLGFAKVTRDLTEPRKAEEERIRLAQVEEANRLKDAYLQREQEARASADAANRMKDEFLATVSHELRTPLNAILGWAKMMRAGSLDGEQRKRAVETIERNAVAMAQLIEDLLDVSRIISGKMRISAEAVDLVTVVDAALSSVRLAADAKRIQLQRAIDPAPCYVLGDPARLQQIVWNLLSNAVKFNDPGGQVGVELRSIDGAVEITVRDNGRGIDARFFPHVFEPFRQQDGGISRRTGGLGLGLAIVRSLVELHGGTIEATSEGPGKGSTFHVRIPTTKPRASEPPPSSTDRISQQSHRPLQKLSVLVVDDEDDARTLTRTILEQAGAHVITAASVAEAMEALAQQTPDILISDIGMPGENGYDLIRQVRALPPEQGGSIPAAALTAYVRAKDRRNVLDAGYMMHLRKPVDPKELVVVVATLARLLHRKG